MITEFLASIDWAALRRQKSWLAAQRTDQAEGLLSLLDGLQDLAVDSYGVPEATVFAMRPGVAMAEHKEGT